MRKYYKNNQTGELRTLTGSVSNGKLLNTFDESDGVANGGEHNSLFVSTEDFENNWISISFEVKVAMSVKARNKTVTAILKMINQLSDHGIAEDEVDGFRTIEANCHIMTDVLFSDRIGTRDDLERHIERRVKESFPEDFADEVLFGEAMTLYYVVYEVRNDFRILLNLLEVA